ncbi:MAG TPA: hypothetical protein PLW02_03905 [Verrucomicrobiota bacterium]|nr:hypothetical protein [Verrucomicrobiota bacterium]
MKQQNKDIYKKTTTAAVIIAVLIAIFILGGILIRFSYIKENQINYRADEERVRAKMEIENSQKQLMDSYQFLDKRKEFVRLPISRSMEIVEEIYKNRDTARTNLLQRIELKSKPVSAQSSTADKLNQPK